MVAPMARTPRKTRPSATSSALMRNMAEPTFNLGNKVDRIMEMPEVPPMAKWLGALKKCTPQAVTSRPRFKSKK